MSDLLNPPPAKITAGDVRVGLLSRFGAKETNGRTAILFEVSNATGHGRNRSADAVIMWCWPSDGLELHGVEIKVARSDWLNEARNPKKAEDIARYCDRWWLVTAPGVVRDVDELPRAWGWRVWDGKSLKVMRDAALTPAVPVDRAFLGSVLRNAGRMSDGIVESAAREARDGMEAEVDRRVESRLRARTPDAAAALLKTVEDFEAATGITLKNEESWGSLRTEDGKRIGRMVAAMKASGLDGQGWSAGSLKLLLARLDECGAAARQVAVDMGVELPEAAKPKKRRAP